MLPSKLTLRRWFESYFALATLTILLLANFWIGSLAPQLVDASDAVVGHFSTSSWLPGSVLESWHLFLGLLELGSVFLVYFGTMTLLVYASCEVLQQARVSLWQGYEVGSMSTARIASGAVFYFFVLGMISVNIREKLLLDDLAALIDRYGWQGDLTLISLATVLSLMPLVALSLRLTTVTGLSNEPI
ncbi:MAG: hypothetical protein MPN21_19900 [Thermoanaerobaculia bacterium]|nr:hypothetical protein [Thermoanaerobaculia bacterium]